MEAVNYKHNREREIVFDTRTGEGVFQTDEINDKSVVDISVLYLNVDKTLMEIDAYLLDENRCSQDEREIIIEGISLHLWP